MKESGRNERKSAKIFNFWHLKLREFDIRK